MQPNPDEPAQPKTPFKPLPPQAERYTSPKLKRLVAVCFQLQLLQGGSPFFLGVRAAARIVGTKNLYQANGMLSGLVRDVILIHAEKGKRAGRRATRFRFNLPESAPGGNGNTPPPSKSDTLEELGKRPGMLGVIFRKAQNKIQDPAKLRRLIVDLIDKEEWSSLSADVKGDAYEGLLQKNAEDVKGGAGQYFTPRPLIAAMVDVIAPHLQAAGVSYLFCGKEKINLHVALQKLGNAFRLRKLMLQGGGKFNGAMLKAGLVDEISHVTVPVADGGAGVSSIFDIPGKASTKAAATLRLLSHKKLLGGVIWARYRVVARHTQQSN